MAETAEDRKFTLVRGQTTARFVLRGDMAVARLAVAAFGVVLPETVNRASINGARAVLMLGPDEWLLLAGDALAGALELSLLAAMANAPASLVDITHRQIGLELSGPQSAVILNAAMPLDLSLRAFPVGMATRTFFEKADIVLLRKGEQAFHIEVWRSFAPYVEALLEAFAREQAAA